MVFLPSFTCGLRDKCTMMNKGAWNPKAFYRRAIVHTIVLHESAEECISKVRRKGPYPRNFFHLRHIPSVVK